jgi:molybdate transport system substrate-binding protein
MAVALTVALLISSATSASVPAGAVPARAITPSGEITVFAASSLTEAFTAIGRRLERRNPGTTITFSFGASSTLASQIEAGAPADVIALADEADAERVADSVRGESVIFARNRLMIAVEAGNPRSIETLSDTTAPGVLLVLCAAEVPCGAFARRAYRRAGVPVPDAGSAENVKAALTTVILGEADAAIVYATDVQAADGSVDGVRIPRRDNVVARYPIAALRESSRPQLARAFVDYVRSAAGRRTLERFGFLAP